MTYHPQTTRVEREFNLKWVRENPKLAIERVEATVANIRASGMILVCDFSRPGFFTLIGYRPEDANPART